METNYLYQNTLLRKPAEVGFNCVSIGVYIDPNRWHGQFNNKSESYWSGKFIS